jgi:hydroxypyruvate reductase
MAERTDKALARRLFEAGLAAADPEAVVRRALALAPPPASGDALVLAVGKAALRMLAGASDWAAELPRKPETLVVTNAENLPDPPPVGVRVGGHPIPDEGSLAAGAAVAEAVERADGRTRVLLLLSGGASALMAAPAEGLTLADKAEASRLLIASGASIEEVNLVRQQLSRLKGGGLARLAHPAPVTALILSDVVGDDPRAVGSGPAAAPLGTRGQARALCLRLGVLDRLPGAVRARLDAPDEAGPLPEADLRIVGSNATSLAAMAAAHPAATRHAEPLTGDVAEAAARIAASGPGVHLFGGETTVRVSGDGLGGRNQELALRVALSLEGPFAFLSGGTDGRDGPTDAAGGLVDEGTAARIAAAGLDAAEILARNDSNRALAASGDLLVTGGTGTNVADLQVLVRPEP